MPRSRQTSPQTVALLQALLERPRSWHYGYELSKATGLKSGTLYPVLIRLSDQGMLESDWREPEREGRPPRHVYRLTSNGLVWARQQVPAQNARTVAAGRTSKAIA